MFPKNHYNGKNFNLYSVTIDYHGDQPITLVKIFQKLSRLISYVKPERYDLDSLKN